jgi:hypothetical protein
VDGDQVRYAAALVYVERPCARRLRRDHPDVQIGTRADLPVVDVEAVGEGERRPLLHVRRDVVAVDRGDLFIGQQHHDNVGFLDPPHRPPRP